jgi:hypothetical protein
MQERDLVSYGANPPHADWPSGARVAVSFVPNVEKARSGRFRAPIRRTNRSTT